MVRIIIDNDGLNKHNVSFQDAGYADVISVSVKDSVEDPYSEVTVVLKAVKGLISFIPTE